MDSTFIRVLGAWFVNLIQLDVPFKNWKEWVQKVKETFAVMRCAAMCVHSYHSDVDLKMYKYFIQLHLTFLVKDKKLRKK